MTESPSRVLALLLLRSFFTLGFGFFASDSGGNCIEIGLPGKSILRDYFQENKTSQRPFLLLRISFPEDLFLYNSSLLSSVAVDVGPPALLAVGVSVRGVVRVRGLN